MVRVGSAAIVERCWRFSSPLSSFRRLFLIIIIIIIRPSRSKSTVPRYDKNHPQKGPSNFLGEERDTKFQTPPRKHHMTGSNHTMSFTFL